MSSQIASILRNNGHQENATVGSALCGPDETMKGRPERVKSSFLPAIVGPRGGLRFILSQAEPVAATNATVLLTGETGTDKEVAARVIHELSGRRSRNLASNNQNQLGDRS